MKRAVVVSFSVVAVLVLVGIGWWYWAARSHSPYRTITVERDDVVQDVAFSGFVEAKQTVNVAFEVTGLVEEITVDVGDVVEKGDVLAKLDTRVARLESVQSTASRASGQDTARVTWENALNAQTKAKREGDLLLEKRRQAVRNAKTEMDQAKDNWLQLERDSGPDASATRTSYSTFLTKETAYNTAQKLLTETQATVDKSNAAATDASRLAESQYLATTQTGPSIAGLSALEASEAIKEVLLTKSTLLAPISGVVTSRTIEPGEIAVANTALLTIQQNDTLQLAAPAPETDALKVSAGMRATITYDALAPTIEHETTVTKVAPAADIIEGVPTYEVTLAYESQSQDLRPGLSANITVHAAEALDVVALPRRAISVQDSKQIVRVLREDETVEEREIETGLVGSSGTVEVTHGLAEGDLVVIGTNGD